MFCVKHECKRRILGVKMVYFYPVHPVEKKNPYLSAPPTMGFCGTDCLFPIMFTGHLDAQGEIASESATDERKPEQRLC